MKTLIKRLWSDESGVTAIEYGLIAALVAVAVGGIVTTFSSDLKALFTEIGNTISNAKTEMEKGS